jgi:hypothetical protein
VADEPNIYKRLRNVPVSYRIYFRIKGDIVVQVDSKFSLKVNSMNLNLNVIDVCYPTGGPQVWRSMFVWSVTAR